MWVPYLGWEDPLEWKMATHSNILAWKIPWTEGAWRVAIHGVKIKKQKKKNKKKKPKKPPEK